MTLTPVHRTPRSVVVVVLAVLALLLGGPSGTAMADPDEGGSKALAEQLEEAAVAYSKATVELKKSQQRQTDIQKTMKDVGLNLIRLTDAVGKVSSARYKGSQLGLVSRLLETDSGEDMLQGAAVAEYLTWRDDSKLRELRTAQEEGTRQRELLNAEIHHQEKVFADLDKAKSKAEKALAKVGGMVSAGFHEKAAVAQPAPRSKDGGWPSQGCTLTDPTGTGGCVSPRMYHTLIEAQLAGFTRYTRCYRVSDFGEHGLGRACDFSAHVGTFGGVATGADRTYGNKLASWAIKNADALGIMYVIWYKQIWFPGIGWGVYYGDGTASGDHMNHVHISML
jgi:peptidoglycan DL-endopeptidase CwlO